MEAEHLTCSHRLSPLATSFCCSVSCCSEYLRTSCIQTIYLTLNKATLQHPSISQTLVLTIQRILSVLPIAVSEKGSLLVSKIFSKPGCQGRVVAGLRSPVVRQGPRGAASRKGGPAALSLLVNHVFYGRVGLKQLCLLRSSGFGRKSAREVAAFVPSVSLQHHLVLMSKCPPHLPALPLGSLWQGTDPTPTCHSGRRS